MQNVITMNLIAGSATLLAVLPMLGAVAFVTLMIVGRELLVRWLFGWAVRHASGA
jgi:hypothetical protein